MANITNSIQLSNILTSNQIEELLNNTFGNSYISELLAETDDAEDDIENLIEYIIDTYCSIDVTDPDTGEILDTIELNGNRTTPIHISRG